MDPILNQNLQIHFPDRDQNQDTQLTNQFKNLKDKLIHFKFRKAKTITSSHF